MALFDKDDMPMIIWLVAIGITVILLAVQGIVSDKNKTEAYVACIEALKSGIKVECKQP